MNHIVILMCVILMNQDFVISQKDNSFLEVDHSNKHEGKPEFLYLNGIQEGKLKKYVYKLTLSSDKSEDKDAFANDDGLNEYVIVKAKRKLFNVSPYVMMRQLDDIKYMVLWLNMYCEIHPDCDKETLNKELRKVIRAVGEEN